jgi:hypothetical protein
VLGDWAGQHNHDLLRAVVLRYNTFPGRLVTYNPGVAKTFLYTTDQDYWSGELVNLKSPAQSRYLSNGLQWFGCGVFC